MSPRHINKSKKNTHRFYGAFVVPLYRNRCAALGGAAGTTRAHFFGARPARFARSRRWRLPPVRGSGVARLRPPALHRVACARLPIPLAPPFPGFFYSPCFHRWCFAWLSSSAPTAITGGTLATVAQACAIPLLALRAPLALAVQSLRKTEEKE